MFFFGCWGRPGHFWWSRDGFRMDDRVVPRAFERWIDGGYAPRRWRDGMTAYRHLVKNPDVCFVMEATSDADRTRIAYDAEEYAQGRFLIHHKDDHTLMSWWDRTQGDRRGACNSNLVVGGKRDSFEMYELLLEGYPTVAANLVEAGVTLIEVNR